MTIPATCKAPIDVIVSNVQNYSVQVRWTALNGETEWVIFYKESSSSVWKDTLVRNNPTTLTGLDWKTDYDLSIRATCSATPGDTSLLATEVHFTTAGVGTYKITATCDPGGSIAPVGVTIVNHGDSQNYVITVQEGYEIVDVLVDGLSHGYIIEYKFVNIIDDHKIHVIIQKVACNIPIELQALYITTNSADLRWSYTGAISYEIKYWKEGENYRIRISDINQYLFTNLEDTTTYFWSVRGFCGSDNYGDWSEESSFTTLKINDTGIDEITSENLKVYSYGNTVYIVNEDNLYIKQIQIIDLYGRLIYQGEVHANLEIINLNVATGTYMARIFTDKEFGNYKLFLNKP